MISDRENFTRAIEFKSPAYILAMLRVDFDWLREKDAPKIQRIRELQSQLPDAMLDWLDAAKRYLLFDPFS
ncbi:MAG: hypothetical protein ONB16_03295 [candidate division KSB1 bacterium]|nr:hypothetical protein [candidate division KSB1 bacterium]MDZ7333273.1 hypothetical protein [candidate division KSB1 bacterium]MDZ7342706.1 hypothetical protein [candidate division KSB1 bacterium]